MPAILLALAVVLVLSGCSGFGIRSGPGIPVGPSIRTETHILTLLATNEEHAPALQPNQVRAVPSKVALMLTPLEGGDSRLVTVARHVPPSTGYSDMRLLGVANGQLWLSAGRTYRVDLASQRVTEDAAVPNLPRLPVFTDGLTTGHRVTPEAWLGLHVPATATPNMTLMPATFRLGQVPYEPLRDSQIPPPSDRRRLYRGKVDASGPIPHIATWETLDEQEYRNGVVFEKPAGPDGMLIAYEGKYPNLTLHVARVDVNGKTHWTADTRIWRDPELMLGPGPIALRGEPQVESGKFAQPVLVLLDPVTGQMRTTLLRFPN